MIGNGRASVLGLLLAGAALVACASDQPAPREVPPAGLSSCGEAAQTIRCKALLTFSPRLRVYLEGIPVAEGDSLPGAIAAYFPGDDRIEVSTKLPGYGERWAALTMRHEFVHALTWKMPEYRPDALASFVGLRAAIATAHSERESFPKYDQWLRARPECLDDLPHFITGIVELMRPSELPPALARYFAPLLGEGPIDLR